MTQDKVMLLIDADNVSLDVIEQAVAWVGKHFGGPHVRRAYCTAESAVKHQGAFKRLSIRPMVNLAAGKNSTDIALAVDAIDLALAERPDVVVIASSDSDFAPLVSRLREKGCRVIGIGQQGKTGDETRSVYDDYEVLEHRRAKTPGGNEGRSPSRGRPKPPPAQAAKASEPPPPPAASALTPAPVTPALEARPARALGRGGRRKPVPDVTAVEATQAESPRAEPEREGRVAQAPTPRAPRSPDPAPATDAKPARKPRRRRPAGAKRAADAGPITPP
jgi:hypothetical protein